MPLPLILGIGAAVAGAGGLGAGINGGVKMKQANDKMKEAQNRNDRNTKRFEEQSDTTNRDMDALGNLELKILNGFSDFCDTIEKIQNRPEFKNFNNNKVDLPSYNKEELQNVSIGAGVLIGGLGGAAVGAAGGFAAAGATTAAVMAVGTASTGTAIASLSGVAATNATLAALGGGAIAAGGGGMALGTTVLGAATLGVGLLVGGVIFSVTGSSLSNKADEAYNQMLEAEKQINKICEYLKELSKTSKEYLDCLQKVYKKYLECFNYISYIVNYQDKVNWYEFSNMEKIATENTVMLVSLLYKMCKLNIVNQSEKEDEMNTVNLIGVNETIDNANDVLGNIFN